MGTNPDLIRVETALSRYPMHRLAKLGTIAIELCETTRNGEMTLRWEVSPNSKWGQPGPLAYKLDTLVINRRLEEAGRPIPRIVRLGSLREIADAVGSSGGNTTKIKRALYQNAFAAITAKITYRSKDRAERTCEIGDTRYAVVFQGETLPNGLKADAVYLVLHDFYREILDNALTRPLDYDYLRELTPVAQRWYELASFQVFAAVRHGKPAKLLYSEFCMYAPQARCLALADVRKQMARVHAPHLDAGYLAGVEFQATADRDGRPDWMMIYTPGPKARAEHQAARREPLAIEAAPAPEPTGLEAELVARGVTRGVAAELVRDHGEDVIRRQLDAVDWLRAKAPNKLGDAGAYLVAAIRDGYAVPAGLAQDQEKRARKAAEDAHARERAAERARTRREQARIDAYWARLTPEQQAHIDAEALAGADPETRASCEHGLPMVRRACLKIVRESYLRNLLNLSTRS